VNNDATYFARINALKFYFPPRFPPPPDPLLGQAKRRALGMIDQDVGTDDDPSNGIIATMKRSGFAHLLPLKLSLMDDLHYPDFKVEWFEQTVLPFLVNPSTPSKAPEVQTPDIGVAEGKSPEVKPAEPKATTAKKVAKP